MSLKIRNLGSKRVQFGWSYGIFRVYENGTVERDDFDSEWGWPASLTELLPFGTYSDEIFTDLTPGNYFLEKEHYFSYQGTHWTRKLNFTVVG